MQGVPMQQLGFHGEKLCCIVIMTNFLRDMDHPPELPHLLLLLVLLAIAIIKDRTYFNTQFVLIAVILDVAFALTGHKYFYVGAVIFCFLKLLLPVTHYQLPKIPDGVGYLKLSLPAPHNIAEACIFYPTQAVANEKKKLVDWLIPSFLEKMQANDKTPVRVPFRVFKFVMAYTERYKLSFSDEKLADGIDEAIIFSHGLSANIHAYSSLLTRLVAGKRIVICIQHTERYSFGCVPLEERKVEILGRSNNVLSAYDYLCDEAKMKTLLGNNYVRPKKFVIMGHSYGGGTAVQTTSMLAGRQIKAVVALDPWLAPVQDKVLKTPMQVPIIAIENEYFTKDSFIFEPNEAFAKVNNSEHLIRLNLKKGDHLHQCDISFVLGSLFRIVKHPEKSWDWHLVNIGIIEKFLTGLDKHSKLEEISDQILEQFGTVLNPFSTNKFD